MSQIKYENYFILDKKRVFLNNILSCEANCTYCYLKKQPTSDIVSDKIVRSRFLINELKNREIEFGQNGTLITIGNFSECMSKKVVTETIKLVKHFLGKGNRVQLSTKKHIKERYFKILKRYLQYVDQLTIFTTVAIVTDNEKVERGTEKLETRLKNFENGNKHGINCVLYIKPILENQTIKDIKNFKSIIIDHKIKDVVVGSMYDENGDGEPKDFLGKKLNILTSNDIDIVREELSKICNVFDSSSKYMEKNLRD